MNWKIGASIALLAVGAVALTTHRVNAASAAAVPVPQFVPDYSWPKPLPNHWQVGAVDGLYVDSHDLIWIANQSNHLTKYDLALKLGEGNCCDEAPQIIAFNRAGDIVKSWRVSDAPCPGYRCLDGVHTVYVDYKDNVWVTGHGKGDSQILKFDYNGKFLLQIGGSEKPGCCGNQDEENVQGGTGVAVWPATNEVFVTDGYTNRRVVVFDADTGKFKRMWGAYGHQPPMSTMTTKKGRGAYNEEQAAGAMTSPEPERKFEGEGAKEWSTVHSVAITPDGVVWIADRIGNRIQQFKVDGTFIREGFIDRKTSVNTGTVYSFTFSRDPGAKYVYMADGGNKRIHIAERETLKEVGYVGGEGGQMPGAFNHVHVAMTDSAGNLYTGEAAAGAREQKWLLVNGNGKPGPGYYPKSSTHLMDQ
jgi:DNA-binding beta-propeller fold protein YncE